MRPRWFDFGSRVWGRCIKSALLLALCLSGCVVQEREKNPLQGNLEADEGTVVVSITVNTGEVNQFNRIEVVPAAAESGQVVRRQYELVNAVPGLSRDTSLFVGALPAGEYAFKTLFADSVSKYIALKDQQTALIGTFRVAPNTVVDLGRLVLTALNSRVLLGRSALVKDNRSLIENFAADYLKLLSPAPVPGWVNERDQRDVAEAFGLTHPQGAGGFFEAPDGRVWGGTRMGTIIVRETTGKWHVAARTGQLDAILAVTPYLENGSVAVATGELGTFMRIKRDQRVEPVNTGNLPKGTIFFVHYLPEHKEWFVGVKTPQSADLYKTDSLESGNWVRQMGDNIAIRFWTTTHSVWMWGRPGGVGFGSSKSVGVNYYDETTRQWTMRATPNNVPLMALTVGVGDAIGVVTSPGGAFGGLSARTHYSRDGGITWTETDAPDCGKIVAPLVIADGTILEGRGVFGDKGLYASHDNGASWTQLTDSVGLAEGVWSFPTAGLLHVSRGQSGVESIEHSADGGKTWALELTSLDPALFDGKQ